MESVKVNVSNELYNLLSENEKKNIHSYLLDFGCILELKDEFPLPDIGSLVFGADAIELIEIVSALGKDGLDLLAKHDNEIIHKVIECIEMYTGPALLVCLLALSVKTAENKRLVIARYSAEKNNQQKFYSVDRNVILTSMVEKLKLDKSYANRRVYGASIAEFFTAASCFGAIDYTNKNINKSKDTGYAEYAKPASLFFSFKWCWICPELC